MVEFVEMSNPKIYELTLPDGSKTHGIEIEFHVVKEDWNEYALENGATLRVKNAVTRVYHLIDDKGNPVYNANGEPQIYLDAEASVITSEDNLLREVQPDGRVKWYAIHPVSGKQVAIDPEQRWFWTSQWQAGEQKADEDLKMGRYEDFDNVDDFINSL
jgi:hypothetical protein